MLPESNSLSFRPANRSSLLYKEGGFIERGTSQKSDFSTDKADDKSRETLWNFRDFELKARSGI